MAEPGQIDRVIFVWNAEKNLKGRCVAVVDFLRQQHSCSLCEIAYDTVKPRAEWEEYRQSLGIPTEEIYKNQLSPEQQVCVEGEYPAVLGRIGAQYVRLLNSRDIEQCGGDLSTFKARLDARLAGYVA